jgi:UDP-N-acetylglucosamine 2-epimerase (non-hydrolysing)
MKALSCMAIVGTRPEAIKLAPVVLHLRRSSGIRTTLLLTGQHREIVDETLQVFDLRPDIDLDLMQTNQTLQGFAARALKLLTKVLEKERPDLILVQGDTTTVFVASLAAFYQGIAVGHVEAGLRTGDKRNPFPEEINRQLTSVLADIHFAPTVQAGENLLRQHVDVSRIFITGNTVIDALNMIKEIAVEKARTDFPFLANGKRTLLVTSHRRENHGEPLEQICQAVSELVKRDKSAQIIWPVHPNPSVSEAVHRLLDGTERIHLIKPLQYCSFVGVMALSTVILTDSGGVQEEAPALGKPVLVLRETTERPEAIAAGTAKLVGTSASTIVEEVSMLLEDELLYHGMARAITPYGDGRAAERIVAAIQFHFGLESIRPESFGSERFPSTYAEPQVAAKLSSELI